PGGSNGQGSDLADVRGLEPLRAPRHLELHAITLGQALEAVGLDGAEVHEHVLAILLGDEAVPLRVVEPLDLTLCHLSTASCLVLPARTWRSCPPGIGGQTTNAAGQWSARRCCRAVMLLLDATDEPKPRTGYSNSARCQLGILRACPAGPPGLQGLVDRGLGANPGPAIAHGTELAVAPRAGLVGIVRAARMTRPTQGHDPAALVPVVEIEHVPRDRGRPDL